MLDTAQALAQIQKPSVSTAPAKEPLLIAGAAGTLGNELVNALSPRSTYAQTQLLARSAFAHMPARVGVLVAQAEPVDWAQAFACQRLGVVVASFEPARSFYGREAALIVPSPEQMPALARAAHAAGAHTLAVVLPHQAGSLPNALKAALAGFDEMALNDIGFERLLIVRAAASRGAAQGSFGQRWAHWMLGIAKYMVPNSEQPVRAVKVAQFVGAALDALLKTRRAGVFVAPPEVVWQAAQVKTGGDTLEQVVQRWLEA
jgi:hypothetical protein